MTPLPPRLSRWLLERVLPEGAAQGALGDLEEDYSARLPDGARAARRWYRREAASLAWAFTRQRLDALVASQRRPRLEVSAMGQDMRYALRALRRSPGFAAIAVVVLALGIGATTAIFSFVDGVLLRPLPYRNPERIVLLWERPPDGGPNVISTLNYLDWERQNQVFEAVAATAASPMTLGGRDEPVEVRSARVRPAYFDLFGAAAALGRTFRPDEGEAGKDHVVVISHRLWQARFGGDPAIVGRSITLDREPYTVVGVMPEGSAFDRGWTDAWRPMAFAPGELTRNYHWLRAIARIKPGVTFEQARANLDTIGARIAREFPESNKDWGILMDRMQDAIVDSNLRRSLQVLLAAVGLLLALACANLANLALARGTSREREVVVCGALGASRVRIFRQFILESLILSFAGGLLGLLSAAAMMQALMRLLPPLYLPREAAVALDWRAFGFAAATAIVSGLLFGAAPALHARRADLAGSMRATARSTTADRSRRRLRDVLVIVELVISCVLLAGAGLLMRSFLEMRGVDIARDADHVLSARLTALEGRFRNPDEARLFYRQLSERIRALPGVGDAALTAALPLQGWPDGMPIDFANGAAPHGGAGVKMVEPSYFKTLGLTIVRGRGLSDRDGKGAPPVAVVNESFVRRHLASRNPIGVRVLIQEIVPGVPQLGPKIPWEIVGVVSDERINRLDSASAGLYVTMEQSPIYGVNVVARTAGDARALVGPLNAAVHALDPDQSVSEVRTLQEAKDLFVAPDRLRTWLFGTFSALALTLAAIGIYGVISYSVAQRTHEIGVRAALGADRSQILGLVMRRASMLTLVGLSLGAAAALAGARSMSALLFGVSPRDPLTLAGALAVLAVVALLAAWIPARRAAAVDPIQALRIE